MTDPKLMPTFYLSHGGGPWPWMKGKDSVWAKLQNHLQAVPSLLPDRPKAILCITGHWEAREFTVSTNSAPGMLYDYYGFPDHTYTVTYPAPGHLETANRVVELLKNANIRVSTDSERGFDHGTFVPLAVAFPDADIPVVQMSLQHNLDPEEHVAMGRALKPLRADGVLIVGSGSSFHDMTGFLKAEKPSAEFHMWLDKTLVQASFEDRRKQLMHWSSAPGARLCHPREDHLVPLMVAVGAAEKEPGTRVFHQNDLMGHLSYSSFMFGV